MRVLRKGKVRRRGRTAARDAGRDAGGVRQRGKEARTFSSDSSTW